ncbi:hypothetical protein AB0D29_11090 [Streptomyces sp. NPDC048424]|uniref:hypothetical protein n=1 Tax=Streptomyces sp. NPDC048424 TaxID=3155265 RepID=UPI00344970E6
MATLRILKIECHRVTTGIGDDDCEMLIDNESVFRKQMGDGDEHSFNNLQRTFTNRIKILVWERDRSSPSDIIGVFYANKFQADQGDTKEAMSGDGSLYDLTYRVTQ